MKDQIRVLMLLPNLRVSNGVTSYAMNYFNRIDHDSVHMDFAVFQKKDSPYEEDILNAGSKISFLPPVKNFFAHVKACKEILKSGDYDIIHDNSLLVTYPIMRAARKYVPVRILHSHSSKLGETVRKELRNAFFFPLLLRHANAYASCSDLAAKAMFGDAEFELIPNCVDANKFEDDEAVRRRIRREMDADNKRIIATVGRTAAQKNPFFALDVFDLVAERIPEAEYWWIGSGPLDGAVAEYTDSLRHRDRVKLLGSRNDMEDLYQAVDLFFLPSFFEGLPVTGIEAQAVGLPCVLSDTITKEVVYTDLVEFVSLSESKEAWADAVCDKLARTGERRGRKEELIKSKFSNETAGEFLEGYYRKLTEGAV